MVVKRSVKEGKKFEGLDYVRAFPGVYLGQYIVETAIREVIENAVDEARRKATVPDSEKHYYADKVEIFFWNNGLVEVRDNGRGMPIDFQEEDQLNGIVFFLGNIMSGSNFDQSKKGTTTGTHGIGASATNGISVRFDVITFIAGKVYEQFFHQGRAGFFEGDGFDPNAAFTEAGHERLKPGDISKYPGHPEHGTWIRFMIDPTVETGDEVNIDNVIKRAIISACLTEDLEIIIHQEGKEDISFGPSTGHSSEVLRYLYGKKVTPLAEFDASFTYEKSAKNADGEKVTRPGTVDVSLNLAAEPQIVSAVNSVFTPSGGSHLTATQRAISSAMKGRKIRDIGLKKNEDHPEPEDYLAVVDMVISATTTEPGFSGQDKMSLGNRAFGNAIEKNLTQSITAWVVQPVNKESVKKWAKQALVHARSRRKIQAEKEKARNQQVKAANGMTATMALPENLVPCRNTGRGSGAEIHIVEGKSALGTIANARHASWQAGYPVRGKFINAFGDGDKVTSNQEFKDLEAVLGCGIGEHCDPEKCNYDRILLTADGDPDGYHIAGLLMLLFYEYYTPLVNEGMVFISMPPLHVLTVGKGKNLRKVYALNDEMRDDLVQEFQDEGYVIGKDLDIQRCKGLGEMSAEDFAETVMNPDTRVIMQVTPEEGDERSMQLMYAKSADLAEQRRQWIIEGIDSGAVDEELLS